MAYQNFKVIQNIEKKMPCNIEAEQAVIGSILVSNELFDDVSILIDSPGMAMRANWPSMTTSM